MLRVLRMENPGIGNGLLHHVLLSLPLIRQYLIIIVDRIIYLKEEKAALNAELRFVIYKMKLL